MSDKERTADELLQEFFSAKAEPINYLVEHALLHGQYLNVQTRLNDATYDVKRLRQALFQIQTCGDLESAKLIARVALL